MCSRHERQIRDLFVMCSRHQSYLSCLFESLQQVLATALNCSVCFGFSSLCVLKLHYYCFCGIFVNRKYTFDLRIVVCLLFIYMADFSFKMNNKRIIEFGLCRISELFRPRSALSASAFGR